jgi:hypothetical protein
MKPRWLLLAALLALIGILAAVALLKPGREANRKPTLTTLSPDTIQSIRIEHPNQPPIEITRHEEGWLMREPLAARANRFIVENLLAVVAAPIEASLPARGTELARYGLDAPLARVKLDADEIAFGAIHPFQQQQYVRYRDNVYLIASHYYGASAQKPELYLDTRLLAPATRLTDLKLADFSVSQIDGTWQRRPERKALSSDRINEFVSEWQQASALSVQRHAGKHPIAWVTLGYAQGEKPQSLRIGIIAREPELVLYRPDEDLDYHFPAELGKRLLQLEPETPTPAK